MKFALITGGSRGLGNALAAQLSEANWKVRELSRSGEGEQHISCDLSKPETLGSSLSNLLRGIHGESPTELLFIHNAARLGPIKLFDTLSDREIQEGVAINLISPLELMLLFIRIFRDLQVPKTLVNISSGAARKGHAGWSQYCLAKAGMENFMNTLFLEEQNRSSSFRAFSYDPGIMDTEMQNEIRHSSERDFPELEKFQDYKKSGQLTDPRRVAEHLISLIGDEHLPWVNRYVFSQE